MSNLKGVARGGKHRHLSPVSAGPLRSAEHFSIFQLILAFGFMDLRLLCWFSLTVLINLVFSRNRQDKSIKPPGRYLHSTKQYTDDVSRNI